MASTLAMMGGMIVAAALARPLTVKFGKAEISAFSSALAAVICLVLFFIRPESVWVYVGVNVLAKTHIQ